MTGARRPRRDGAPAGAAVPVRKTYELFVGGRFVRSESGRSYEPAGTPSCHVARASRKDLHDAVVAARAGLAAWAGASAYLRGQVLYRLAEMLAARRSAFAAELQLGGAARRAALAEVDAAVSLCIWYAGLPDKLPGLLGSQNAVQGPFFVCSTVEPTGVVGVVAPAAGALAGLLALVLPVLAGGNAVVALASEPAPCAGLALAEAVQTSDFPPGSVNLLAGQRAELLPHLASHRDVDGLLLAGRPEASVGAAGSDNCKRVRWLEPPAAARPAAMRSLLWVEPFVEVKTLWHPVAQ